MIIASIPSPSFNSIDIGPLSLNIYGLCIALGVVAAIWLYGRRLEERDAGTRDDASAIGVVAVIAGVIGARLYHVATDWDRFSDDVGGIFRIWEGGLGIPGGLLLGIPVGLWMSRRAGISFAVAATCAAPAIPLAQAIGRWGNYFNQELYGRPTDLPWALEIDADHLVGGFAPGTTFHPTFLYESLWSLALVVVLLWIDRRFRPPDGQLMVMYLIGYGIGRFWVEGLRIDPADELGGLRWNQWVALATVLGGFVVLAFWPEPAADADDAAAERDDAGDDDDEHVDDELDEREGRDGRELDAAVSRDDVDDDDEQDDDLVDEGYAADLDEDRALDDGVPDDADLDDADLDDGALDDGVSDDGVSDDGALDDGVSDDGALDDGALDDGVSDDVDGLGSRRAD